MTIDSAYIKLPVEYLKQPDEYSCAPTVMAMLLNYRGFETTAENVIAQLHGYMPLAGTEWEDVERYFSRKGLRATFTTSQRTGDLVRLLEHEVPLVAEIPSVEDRYPHVIVVRGHDREGVFVHDPYNEYRKRFTFEEFEWRWRERDSMLLYLPPNNG